MQLDCYNARKKKVDQSDFGLCMMIGLVLPYGVNSTYAATDGSQVVISQVYGGGGNLNAVLKNDFIELYNPTDTTIDITGWRVRYAASSGTISETSGSTALTGTIKAKGYYLIQEAAGTGGTASLPAPDKIGTIAMGGTGGKVDLVRGTGGSVEVLDFVAYATSNTTAAIRKAAPGAHPDSRGFDSNSDSDFRVDTPDPRNSSYVVRAAAVTAAPAPNAWPAGTLSVSLESATAGSTVYASVNGAEYAQYSSPLTIQVPSTIRAYAARRITRTATYQPLITRYSRRRMLPRRERPRMAGTC
ncbi:lamin tail domain-containing protein [Cohnella kolymensis]|uniref:lamin tail domain-containing protein n=1 Tax=Cohnella kolymensis TaxID=1590652 RepID=UPI000695FE75|nr:lamin tail domain-containing protein [Cohnella kolymensis]